MSLLEYHIQLLGDYVAALTIPKDNISSDKYDSKSG